MIYTLKQLRKKYKYTYNINKAINDGEIIRIGHGLYSTDNPAIYELEIIFAKYPNSILCMQSAFAYYDVSDYIPTKYYIATSQNAHKIENEKVCQFYMTNDILNIGKQTIKTRFGYINIYDRERMLIELIRLKSKFDYSYYKEIVNSYRELAKDNQLDNNKIIKYCSCFKNGDNIRKTIQEVIL